MISVSIVKYDFCIIVGTEQVSNSRYADHLRITHWDLQEVQKEYTAKPEDLCCDKCSQEFETMVELCQHKIDVHQMIKCGKCSQLVIALGYLERHEKARHTAEFEGTVHI